VKVGLDFGTSNSSVAVADGQQVKLLPLEPGINDGTVLRSLLYIPREGPAVVGQAAVETYFQQNTGRPVRLVRKFLRVIEMTFAEIGTIRVPAHALIDQNAPGRFFQSLKSFLRDRSFAGTDVFGTTYTLEDLIAVILREIKRRTEAALNQSADGWVIGRPVHFADDPEADTMAALRLAEACRRAGLGDVRFELEPVAAGLHYAARAERPATALIFDMGGGTLDLTVLKVGQSWEVLATDGVPIAGDAFDSRIIAGCVLQHFGLNATMGPRADSFPIHIPLALTEWSAIPNLNQPRTLGTIREARRTSPQRQQIAALECLVTRNYGLTLYEEVRRAKVALSSQLSDAIAMDVEEIQFCQPITRTEFEHYIAAECARIAAAVDRVIAAAGLLPGQIDVVLRTGGSSAIPWFVAMLERKVGPGKVVEHDVFTSVAAGLGLSAAKTQ
jgi:hypothetical chaperone protein